MQPKTTPPSGSLPKKIRAGRHYKIVFHGIRDAGGPKGKRVHLRKEGSAHLLCGAHLQGRWMSKTISSVGHFSDKVTCQTCRRLHANRK